MMSGTLSLSPLAAFQLVALAIFVGIFLGMLAWVFRPGSRPIYESRARMALDPNDHATSEQRRVQP